MLEYPEVNRRQFLLALSRAVESSNEGNTSAGLLLVDISNLGRINQIHGYQAGDIVLATAVERLQAISTLEDNVFRIGSHQMAFILPSLANPAFIALAVNRVHSQLAEPILAGEEELSAQVTVGYATSQLGDADSMQLLVKAERSLADARAGGSAQFVESEQGAIEVAQERLQLEQDIVEAINANAFTLAYQPKVDLASGKIRSCEALLRFQRPRGDHVPPDLLVEVAESLGLGYALNKWVLGEAVRQSRHWQERYGIGIAVNMEANLVDSPDLYNLVADTLAIWHADRRLITLEVTESAVISDKDSGFNNLKKLTDMGVSLSIDDFGTGYSSLSYFKHIPAQELKIDRSFVGTMTSDPQNKALVNIIIDIAHLFGMTVVGEGVEDRACLEALIDSGCDYAQGFYFSKPLDSEAFEQWLDNWKGLDSLL